MVLEIWAKGEAAYELKGNYFEGNHRQIPQDPRDRAGRIHQALPEAAPADRGDRGRAALEGRDRGRERGWAPISANFLLPEWVASHWPKY